MPNSELQQGFEYFFKGWKLITQPGLRRFVVMPILINILMLSGLFWLFIYQVGDFTQWMVNYVPEWLVWLRYIVYILAVITILIIYYFTFNLFAGLIAAPFNGILSEKVEAMLTGEKLADSSMLELLKDTPRMMRREWQKVVYSIPRFLGLVILGFIPGLGQTVVPILFFIFTAWMVAIQYCDYPFDNHRISFHQMRADLADKRILNLSFGGLISLFTFVPFLNFIIIPIAVCGATALWVDHYRDNSTYRNNDYSATGRTQVKNSSIVVDNRGLPLN